MGITDKHSAEQCSKSRRAIQDTLDVLNGKWKLPILHTLTFGTYRFKELAREIGISPRMLSKELKDLEENKLISRTVYNTMPVTVEYTITGYGKTLRKVLSEMRAWGEQHRKTIFEQDDQQTSGEDCCNS